MNMNDEYVSLATALRGDARTARVHPSTARRWVMRGVQSKAGVRVKLAAQMVGGQLKTRPRDLADFLALLAEPMSSK